MVGEKKKRRRLERHLPAVGTQLTHRYKGRTFVANIVADAASREGRAVAFDGKRYATLTAAARSITGYAVNGWVFWNTR